MFWSHFKRRTRMVEIHVAIFVFSRTQSFVRALPSPCDNILKHRTWTHSSRLISVSPSTTASSPDSSVERTRARKKMILIISVTPRACQDLKYVLQTFVVCSILAEISGVAVH
eukprot:12791489-Heterocapsa_arctica.AAC.1